MKQRHLGSLGSVSALTLGGGGIGQVWGNTTREESVATVKAAVEAGITLFDMAPLYGRGEAETVMGEAFSGGYPEGIRVTTKCMLGTVPEEEVLPKLRASLEKSCGRMKRSFIDLFVLHGSVVPDGFSGGPRAKLLPKIAVPLALYQGAVVPAMKTLVSEGLIGAWGITAAGPHAVNLEALGLAEKPAAVQCITNLLDSPGGMVISDETPKPREITEKAQAEGVGVMGIRAVAAGSLTDKLDRDLAPDSPEVRDYERSASFRSLALEMGESSASLAHRYALSMPGVDTVILGVKNREELADCLAAEAKGDLDPEQMLRIDGCVTRQG